MISIICVFKAYFSRIKDVTQAHNPYTMIQSLTHKVRTRRANRQLGGLLAFVAGAADAGGFLAIHRCTSHTKGIVSELADVLVLGNFCLAVAAPPLWQHISDWLQQTKKGQA